MPPNSKKIKKNNKKANLSISKGQVNKNEMPSPPPFSLAHLRLTPAVWGSETGQNSICRILSCRTSPGGDGANRICAQWSLGVNCDG